MPPLPPPRNPYICLAIVLTLGGIAAVGMLGLLVLPAVGKQAPSEVVPVVGTCIGALCSFLVSVPRGQVGGDNRDPKEGR